MKKLIPILVTLVVLIAVGVTIFCCWPAIKGTIDKSKYYTSEQLEDAVNNATKNEKERNKELSQQIDYYKDLTDEYYLTILDIQKQNTSLQAENQSLQLTIISLQNTKTNLQSEISNLNNQISDLNQTISENEEKISDFKRQIAEKEKEISDLKSSSGSKESEIKNLEEEITSLNKQISNLNSLNAQLESTNQSNLSIISSLNEQISELGTQISTLQNQYLTNQDVVDALNDKISQLEKSIEYYEEFIKNLEDEEKIVATFEFNGSIISVQTLQKGGQVEFPTPSSTEYVIFNYWETESGERVNDTSSYTISESIKFVANVTLKYDVKFSVDGDVKETQIVEKGQMPSSPSIVPLKDGYDFDGWTLNGVDVVDVTNQTITSTTTFVAKFTQKFTVTFMYENETKSTQEVRIGGYAQDVMIQNTTYKVFNGWKVNGEIVTVEDYQIFGVTVFVADLTYYYDVVFMVDDQQYGQTQVIMANNFATVPKDPSKDSGKFKFWTLNGNDEVDVSSYVITHNTTFIAKFINSFGDSSWTEIKEISEQISSQNMNSDMVLQIYGWQVGDEKTISLTTEELITFVILDFNHDDKSDKSGKAGISIGMKNLLTKKYGYYFSAAQSEFDVNLAAQAFAEIKSQLPEDLKSVIVSVEKPATKYTSSYSSELWSYSISEIYGPESLDTYRFPDPWQNYMQSIRDNGTQYAYFKNLIGSGNASSSESELVRRLSDGSGEVSKWFLRNGGPTNYQQIVIDETGKLTYYGNDQLCGYAFGFCV